jgi:hypothetical protein
VGHRDDVPERARLSRVASKELAPSGMAAQERGVPVRNDAVFEQGWVN